MNNTDKVLLAAYEAGAGERPITIFDLTVRAWLAHKAIYGLPGYENQHPDHKKVYVATLHLLGRTYGTYTVPPYLERTGTNKLKLTALGLDRAQQLTAGTAKPKDLKMENAGYIG